MMRLIKTSELAGAALDWAVATCNGDTFVIHRGHPAIEEECDPDKYATEHDFREWKMWTNLDYSVRWDQGGPIIERVKITVAKQPLKDVWHASIWEQGKGWTRSTGPTPLIAAMRCFVASKLGDEVEIPVELL